MAVHIVNPRHKKTNDLIDVTSRSLTWSRGLSPFVLGPVELPDGQEARNVENLWQYSKVYSEHVGWDGNPNPEWYRWASEGFRSYRAERYPMGKGRRPEYSWWNGNKLNYIEARKKIYVPIYAKAVLNSPAFKKLKEIHQSQNDIWLWDFDGYDYEKERMSLLDVLDCETRKMGHCFVLALLLTPQDQWGRKNNDGHEMESSSLGEAKNRAEIIPPLVMVDSVGSVDRNRTLGSDNLFRDVDRESEGSATTNDQADCSGGIGKEELLRIIVPKLFETLENRNSAVVYHNEGVLRGLIWAYTGRDPGRLSRSAVILKMLGVPYEVMGSGESVIPDTWLAEHGLAFNELPE